LKEIRAREAEDARRAEKIMNDKADANEERAIKELEDERERARLAELERIRREKEARERAIRMKEKRSEMLWIHF
jgi:hypothetical protein